MKKILTLGLVFLISLNFASADQKTTNDKNVKITNKDRVTFSGDVQDFDPNQWENTSFVPLNENKEVSEEKQGAPKNYNFDAGDAFIASLPEPEKQHKQNSTNINFYSVFGNIFFYGLCFFGLLYAISLNSNLTKKLDNHLDMESK